MRSILVAVALSALADSAVAQSPAPPMPPLPSIQLPTELDRVLRDYERHWRSGNTTALSDLFTPDGIINRRQGWLRGRAGIRDAYAEIDENDLRLRAVAYATDDTVGYIVGAYGFGDGASTRDTGRFVLTLRRRPGAPWLIALDVDILNRP